MNNGLKFLDIKLKRSITGYADNLTATLRDANADACGDGITHLSLPSGGNISLPVFQLQTLGRHIDGGAGIPYNN